LGTAAAEAFAKTTRVVTAAREQWEAKARRSPSTSQERIK
jgi:hypothetical protein